ncbi:disulfide bond formation protein DsbA [Nocardia mangyaensis]|uniref:Disulfide bond formation protein DsbA n=1 Tax=Nocardia mangyaensis TaxID=2213200 RepID=A0A1J0VWJ8_9NOCA|nr:disulfide bond formation protein DsbA [Nocardia mangyaensis]APE36389.1 disulfide bond formation protein DsbA [Nocardia mangyaensis]
MAEIDLYVDPVCPFAWVTSRWLLAAAEGSPHTVRLRQMSLAVLNDDHDVDADHQPMIERSRRLGRVFTAATATAGHDAFARLYDTLGGSGGSPIIVIDGHGFNGPVLTESPTAQHGPALLDALVTAATTPGFAALHRPYQSPPRIETTPEDTH